MLQAARNKSGPPRLKRVHENAVWPAAQQPLKVRLAHGERQAPEILGAHRQHEGTKLDFAILPVGMQRVEIRPAIDGKDHRFAVDDKSALPVFQRGLNDPGIALGSIIAALGDQPHARAIAL